MKTSKFLLIIAIIVLAAFVVDLFYVDFAELGFYDLIKMALMALFSMITIYQYMRESKKQV